MIKEKEKRRLRLKGDKNADPACVVAEAGSIIYTPLSQESLTIEKKKISQNQNQNQ